MAKQDVQVEAFYSGVWNNLTTADDVRAQQPISITRGAAAGDEQLQPAIATLELDNRDGRYALRNPNSPLYGLIGLNTPLRIYTGVPHPGAANSDVTDTTSLVAPSVTVPASPGTGLLISAWAVPSSTALITHPLGMTGTIDANGTGLTTDAAFEAVTSAGATGTRTATCTESEDYVACSAFINGPQDATSVGGFSSVTGVITVPVSAAGDWWVLIGSYRSDPAAEPADTLTPVEYPRDTDGGGWMLLADTGSVQIGDAEAEHLRMKIWCKRVKTAANDPDHVITIPDDGVEEVHAILVRLPVAKGVTDFSFRFHGEVAAWPVSPTVSGHDVVTPIAAAGITRRIGRQKTSTRDTVRRFVERSRDVCCGYWPVDDLDGSRRVEAVVGGPMVATTVIGVRGLPTFGAGQLGPHLPAGAEGRTDGGVRAPVTGGIAGGFCIDLLYRAGLPAGAGADTPILFAVQVDAGVASYAFQVSPNTGLGLIVLNTETGAQIAIDSAAIGEVHDGQVHHLRMRITDQAASTSQGVFLDVDGVNQVSLTAATGETVPGAPGFVSVAWAGDEGNGLRLPVAFSQITLWNETVPGLVDSVDAYAGHAGDRPAERLTRLFTEEGIPFAIVGEPADEEVLLGPQFPDSVIQIASETAAAGQGWLYEAREFPGLVYRTPGSAYNTGPTFSRAAGAGGLGPLVPVPDDQQTANDVTATGRIGGTARSIQATGPKNVQPQTDDPQGVGLYDVAIRPNVLPSGNMLGNQANRRRGLGTVAEDRLPAIVCDLDAAPAIAADVAAVDVADRMIISDPPPWMEREDVDQLAQGYTEVIGTHRRVVTFVGLPGSPYRIAEVEHAELGFIQSDTATCNENLSTTDTVMQILANGYPWVYEADFDILVGGERMTVTAVPVGTGAFPNRLQNITVTRSVNGVVKEHPIGTPVEFLPRAYIGL